jgi:hypothetical protein
MVGSKAKPIKYNLEEREASIMEADRRPAMVVASRRERRYRIINRRKVEPFRLDAQTVAVAS